MTEYYATDTDQAKGFVIDKVMDRLSSVLALVSGILLVFMAATIVLEAVLRFFFNAPTVWVYELNAQMLAPAVYLGLLYATYHKSHIRIDILFDRFRPHVRNWLWLAIHLMASLLGIAALTGSTMQAVSNYRIWPTTLGAHIPVAIFLLFIPIGVFLFLIQEIIFMTQEFSRLRAERQFSPVLVKTVLIGLGVILLFVGVPLAFRYGLLPALSPATTTIVAAMLFLVALFLGIPIAFSLGLVSMATLIMTLGFTQSLNSMGTWLGTAIMQYSLLPIPLFMLMAEIVLAGGAQKYLMAGAEALTRGVRGGHALAAMGAATVFATLSGSSAAACACIGPMAISAMNDEGYKRNFSAGVVAAGGGLAVLIPPSGVFIIYSFIAEVSLAKLFIAGFLPGFLVAFAYFLVIFILIKVRPDLAPTPQRVKPAFRKAFHLVPFLILGFGMLIAIYAGFTSVIETSALGALGALIIAVCYEARQLRANFAHALKNTANITGYLFFIIAAALYFGYMLTYLGIPIAFSKWIVGLGLDKWLVLAIFIVFILILGMFLDGLTIILMVFPIILGPLAAMGFDLIWLGIVLTLCVEIGFTTPPYGINIFVLQGSCKHLGVTYRDVVTGSAPYIVASITCLIILILFPQITLWLPSLMEF